jgi:beta-lactamase regulating signal transducer with metallopeptidase domain
MLIWILNVSAAGLLLGLAALAFERSARLRQMMTRWVWGVSMITSVLIPLAVTSTSVYSVAPRRANHAIMPERVASFVPLTASGSSVPLERASATTVASLIAPRSIDGLLLRIWCALSGGLILAIMLSGVFLHWRKRRWGLRTVAGVPVLVSTDSGPAVIGLIRSRIVVPQWLVALTPDEQNLVIAHEQSHLEARDPQFLAGALCLLVCMPWNVALWWQLRRLRAAIEIDCDARILKRGHDITCYGETLIAVGERQTSSIGMAAAMSASTSFLEQRIRIMLRKKTRSAWLPSVALACFGVALVATAAEVSPSMKDVSKAFDAAFDTASLDRHVGLYQFPDNAVLAITRDGNHLASTLSGPTVPPQSKLNGAIFPMESTGWTPGTEFSYKDVDAQIRFNTPFSLVLRLDGRYVPAKRIDEAASQQLVDLQTRKIQNPKGEAALRHLIEIIRDGRPDGDAVTRIPAENLLRNGSAIPSQIAALGPVKSVQFVGVNNSGVDIFNVEHENGLMQWRLLFNSDGNIVKVGLLSAASIGALSTPMQWQ